MVMNALPGFLQANDPPMFGANLLVRCNRAQVATTLAHLAQRFADEPGVTLGEEVDAVGTCVEVVVGPSQVAPENVPVVAGCQSLGDAGRPAWGS
jgi:hypothetical protein